MRHDFILSDTKLLVFKLGSVHFSVARVAQCTRAQIATTRWKKTGFKMEEGDENRSQRLFQHDLGRKYEKGILITNFTTGIVAALSAKLK